MENKNKSEIDIELSDEVAQGTYTNLAVITHSATEFVLDFIIIMPGLPKAQVKSRIILTPENAKSLMNTLHENILRYEKAIANIKPNVNTIPLMKPSGIES